MIKRATTWFITAFAFVFLSHAQAKLPFNAFKNVSKHFNNVYYSPVLGMSALESGIIKTIRFAFVDNEVINQDTGLRIFLADQISNPHGHIAKILFPSVTGELGIDTNAQLTLSSHATPKFMATLMVIVSKMRYFVENQPEALERFLTTVWDTYFFKATKQSKSGILAKVTLSTTDRNKLKKQVTELFTQIRQAIFEEEQGASLLPKYSVEQLISAFVCTKLNTRDELEAYLISLYKQDTEHLIFRDLSLPSSSSIKPFEDIALFDFKDEDSYLEVLTTTLHAPSESSSSSSSAASSSGSSVSVFGDTSRILDALYAVTVMPYLSKPIPYINDAPSHGPAGFVEGVEATVNPARGTFSDCNENSLRVLLNLMIFDANKRQFNLAFLENASGPRVEILKAFYTKYQDISNVGSTSREVRTQWNRVLGDLNSLMAVDPETIPLSSSSSSASSSSTQDVTPSTPHVRYLQGNNELDSGFANVLRVFEKVLGLSLLPSFPETGSIEEKEAAIRQGFMALFKFIAPEKSVELKFNKLQSKPGDLAGKMTVSIDDKFRFTLFEGSGTHGHIEDIHSLVPQSSRDQQRLAVLARLETVLQTETIATFKLLQENKQKLVNNAFYNLFSTPIYGNGEALAFLQKLANMPDNSKFNSPLKFVLKQIAWDDPFYRQQFFAKLESMLGGSYDQAIFEGIGYFEVSVKYPIEFVEKNMKNLIYINFKDQSYDNIQNVMPNIKKILLPSGAESPVDLSKVPNIESLDLSETQIPFLNFTQPMPNLKSLILPATITDWSQVKGIENLPVLESLHLIYPKITSLEFTQPMPNLKVLTLPRVITYWSQVKGIENLQALEWLDVSESRIPTLEFTRPMTSLKTILLPATTQSCILYGKKEDWEIKQSNTYGYCRAEADKPTICVRDPSDVKFTFLGDMEGAASSSLSSN